MVEKALGGVDLFSAEDTTLLSRVNLALHAHALLHRDVHYVVRDGKVRLINESRGRIALLQRWPDGLQAAVEAKEHLGAQRDRVKCWTPSPCSRWCCAIRSAAV